MCVWRVCTSMWVLLWSSGGGVQNGTDKREKIWFWFVFSFFFQKQKCDTANKTVPALMHGDIKYNTAAIVTGHIILKVVPCTFVKQLEGPSMWKCPKQTLFKLRVENLTLWPQRPSWKMSKALNKIYWNLRWLSTQVRKFVVVAWKKNNRSLSSE